MANVFGSKVWELDGDGVITVKPIWVRKAVLYPNAADDLVIFRYWGAESSNTSARSSMIEQTCTVTSNNNIESTGNFETSEALAGDVINITTTSTDNNEGYWQINTRTDNNNIVLDTNLAAWGASGGTLTNEASKTYTWKVWQPDVAFKMSCYDANEPVEIDFGECGFRFPNLAMDTLTSNAKVYLYLR